MHTRLIDANPQAGIETWHHYDPVTEECHIETRKFVQDIIAVTKAEFASVDERARWKDGMGSKVASIPMCIYFELKERGILDDQKAMKAWLNNRDNMVFRTRPGKI
jgi:hypothetical protein